MKSLIKYCCISTLLLGALIMWGCGGDSSSVPSYSIKTNKNVIYKHGDMMKYDASGSYIHADGSKMVLAGGWFRVDIVDEGLKNPLNNNIPVLTLIEVQSFDINNVDKNGKASPMRLASYYYIYFTQDPQTGTIHYQGEKTVEYGANGTPVWKTYWFDTPKDHVQYQFPLHKLDKVQVPYFKRTVDGTSSLKGAFTSLVEDTESVSAPLGTFETFRIRCTNTDPTGNVISDRMEYNYPDIGIVKLLFYSTTPGDTGALTLALSETNIDFQGGNKYTLSSSDKLPPNVPGVSTKYNRSGFYISDDGTVEEISGWFTMEVLSDTVLNPVMNKTLNTLLETHYTETKATDIIGNVTITKKQEAFKRYFSLAADNSAAFGGDTGTVGTPVAGQPIWFDKSFSPMNYPYFVGETQSQTISLFAWMNGAAIPLYSFTPTMQVSSILNVASKLGTFESYLMTYVDTNGKTVEQYSYPKLGVVKFRYPAPPGKVGYMDVTVSSTNVPYK